jgi:KaiC/GvpD/RAD55 family RecA-like ATPase
MAAVDEVLQRLERVRKSGGGWTSRCPAHDDDQASLSIGVGDDGRVLLNCFAGCAAAAIVEKVGLELRDLFQKDDEAFVQPRPRGRVSVSESDAAAYAQNLVGSATALQRLHELRGWTTEAVSQLGLGLDGGEVVFPVRDRDRQLVGLLRYQPNPERRSGPKMKAAAGTPRELFPPPETVPAGSRVFLCEGEPDAVSLASVSLAAVGLPGVKSWKKEWASRFAGRAVVVLFDCDAPGRDAAEVVSADLAAEGIDVRVVDLNADADNGYDVGDLLGETTTVESREAARRYLESVADATSAWTADGEPRLSIVPAQRFAAVKEAGCDPLVGGGDHGTLVPAGGDVLIYGDGGAGKTTLCLHLALHLAAGDPWLGIPVAAPSRVLVVECEGPRAGFRAKVDEHLANWTGEPVDERLLVWETPWAAVTFLEERWREILAERIAANEVDVLIIGPVTAVGMTEAGTIQQVREFASLVADVRTRSGRPLAVILVHHESKLGRVSGAWEGVGDTLIHLQPQGHGRTRLHVQKARWSSHWHKRTLHLIWSDVCSFVVDDTPELDDETIGDQIIAALRANPGSSWSAVERETPGVRKEKRRQIRDGLFAEHLIVNIARSNGAESAIYECPERKPSRLYSPDDPTIRHLVPPRGAGGAQMTTSDYEEAA